MDYDIFFRNIMLLGFLITSPAALYFRIQSKTSEKIDRWQEGWFILFGLRLVALSNIAGVIAYMIDPNNMAWSQLDAPLFVRWIGVAFGFFGGFLMVYAMKHLGKNLTDTVVIRKEHTLVTDGPYRIVRHPFYGAFASLALANALVTANWFLFATGFIVGMFLYKRTDIEEANLTKKFGDDYKNYMKRVGRFFPKIF